MQQLPDIHIHIHNYDGKEILHEIHHLKQLIMASITDFQQALADVSAALDNIAADITRLTDQLQTGGLTAEQEQSIFDQLRAVADRAKSVADITPEPLAPEPTV